MGASALNDKNIQFESGQLKHRFDFRSVYKHQIGSKDQEATTFQNKWITVDYIFYSHDGKATKNNKLYLLSTYKLPSITRCMEMGMVPNRYFGSDHLVLAAKFYLFPDI